VSMHNLPGALLVTWELLAVANFGKFLYYEVG
jgi:hypothetical protein